jgi:hypothetical protein
MARTRSIKPSFFKNEFLAECEPMARLLFIGLWTLADSQGRMEFRPMRIRAELFPSTDDCSTIPRPAEAAVRQRLRPSLRIGRHEGARDTKLWRAPAVSPRRA